MTVYTLLSDARSREQRLADLLQAIDTAGLPPGRREAARDLVFKSMRPTITWESPRPGVHIIDGQQIDSDLIGLSAAFLAMASQGRRLVKALDLAAPGAAQPANTIRNSLKVAAKFLGRYNMRAAAAVRLVRVVDGLVTYEPDGRWDVLAG